VNPTSEPSPSPPPDIPAWLDDCEQRLTHPATLEEQLRRYGWAQPHAAAIAVEYRRRFNEHVLGYSVLLVTTGVAALAAGTAGHILTAGLDRPLHREALAAWLSVLVCTLPFAIWAHLWAARVDREDPVAVWSKPRRLLAQILLWACGVVGGARLLFYATQLIAALVGAPSARHQSLVAGAINVAIAVGIALPLGTWSYAFLHRFDSEDPTAPPTLRHRHGPPGDPSAPGARTSGAQFQHCQP
jgi:hypothetical protein